jgi:hypothetical protein
MFYLALTFWLLVAMLLAYGVFKTAEGMVRPRWINLALLPGTLVAETAHFVAAMLTGAPVSGVALVSDEPIDKQQADPPKEGIPILSPLLMGLLPILAAVAIIYTLYAVELDQGMVETFARRSANVQVRASIDAPVTYDFSLAQELDWPAEFWFTSARSMLRLCERLVDQLPFEDLGDRWQTWLFVYLSACLAIRMVPLRHKLRNGLAGVILVGAFASLLGLIGAVDEAIRDAWPLLAYVIALLTLLLLVLLIIRGAIGLGFALADRPMPRRS